MDLGTVFKLSIYGLTALVGAILGAAEGEGAPTGNIRHDFVLPFLSLPIVVAGYLLTEQRRGAAHSAGMGLSSAWANVLGIVALIATAYEFSSENREGKLLAGTHLLLYATWIVLFQQKTVRLYWFLMALGILQLAVASVLTSKGWFGFCAVAYMFGAVWTLSIFSLWRAEQLFFEEDQRRTIEHDTELEIGLNGSARARDLQSEVRGAVQHEGGTRWLSVRFVSGVLMTTCSALLVSAAFFAFIPRVWVGPEVSFNEDTDSIPGLSKKTGLATTVRLGDFGSVLESMDRVFEIQIVNVKTQRTIPIQTYAEMLGLAEPLFRGAVFVAYDSGRWSPDSIPKPPVKPFNAFERTNSDLAVQQEIRLDPTASDILYCLGQPLMIRDRRQRAFGEINQSSGICLRGGEGGEGGALHYSAFTRLPTQMQMTHTTPVSPNVRDFYQISRYLDRNKKLPHGLNQVNELTQMVIEAETARRQKMELRDAPRKLTPLEIAQALESHLRDSGIYRYSLDLSIDDPKIDPIEDFLINRKAGHCEYFATALCLMMRSARIPARIVSGYKGGIPVIHKKDTLEIQQRFAHLWVEAWVNNEGWTTFDATPEDARSQSIAAISAKRNSLWAGMQTTFSGLWNENVLNMSLDRQEESIYKPIRKIAISTATFVRQLFTQPSAALATFRELLSNRNQWLSFGGALCVIAVLLVLGGLIWAIRFLIQRLRLWMASRATRRQQQRRRVVDFYERFIKILQLRGLQRAPQQTPTEFAEQVANEYSPELAANGIFEVPGKISRMFYRVRFGNEDLSEADKTAVEQMLTTLENAMSTDSLRSDPHRV